MNAKQELLDIVNKNKLTIEFITIEYKTGNFDEDYEEIIEEYSGPYTQELIDKLDFEYNNSYGRQYLFGKVYGTINGLPAWLTREEYDGKECWKLNTIPKYYGLTATIKGEYLVLYRHIFDPSLI